MYSNIYNNKLCIIIVLFKLFFFFFFQAEDGIRDGTVTGVQTCALPISLSRILSYSRACALSASSLKAKPRVMSRVICSAPTFEVMMMIVLRKSTFRPLRSEEHTSELQSQFHLVCRLLLEKKKIQTLPT